MESLKQFRVDFQVTYWCEGRKGIFSKKPYKFTVSFRKDIMNTTFFFNVRTEKEAIENGKKVAELVVQRNIDFMETQQQKGEFMILTGNMADSGKFEWSPKIYDITGYEIKFISCKTVRDWSKESVARAAKELTMEQFKQVFNEIPAEILG